MTIKTSIHAEGATIESGIVPGTDLFLYAVTGDLVKLKEGRTIKLLEKKWVEDEGDRYRVIFAATFVD